MACLSHRPFPSNWQKGLPTGRRFSLAIWYRWMGAGGVMSRVALPPPDERRDTGPPGNRRAVRGLRLARGRGASGIALLCICILQCGPARTLMCALGDENGVAPSLPRRRSVVVGPNPGFILSQPGSSERVVRHFTGISRDHTHH
jgi:hypothetical protein